MTGAASPLSTSALRASVDRALEAIPADKRGAVLAVATPKGISVVVAHRVGDRWTFGGEVRKEVGQSLEASVVVRGTW